MKRDEQIRAAAIQQCLGSSSTAERKRRKWIEGAMWADKNPENRDKETHKFFQHGQAQMLAAICEHLRSQWGIGERDINQLKAIFNPYNDEAQHETAIDDIMGEPMKDVENLINSLHQ